MHHAFQGGLNPTSLTCTQSQTEQMQQMSSIRSHQTDAYKNGANMTRTSAVLLNAASGSSWAACKDTVVHVL